MIQQRQKSKLNESNKSKFTLVQLMLIDWIKVKSYIGIVRFVPYVFDCLEIKFDCSCLESFLGGCIWKSNEFLICWNLWMIYWDVAWVEVEIVFGYVQVKIGFDVLCWFQMWRTDCVYLESYFDCVGIDWNQMVFTGSRLYCGQGMMKIEG